MPVQFPYPETGWSTGKMRKRRDYQPDFEHAFRETAPPATDELTPAQEVFERSRPELPESASGKARAVPSDITMGQMMLRGPAGQIVAGTALGTAIGKKIIGDADWEKLKKYVRDFTKGDMTHDEFKEAIGEHGWSVERKEAEAK